MKKFEVISELMEGTGDIAVKGSSEYIVVDGDIVNKRSKKPLDMKKMMEDGWEIKRLPRWDDDLRAGEEKPTLCVLGDGSIAIITEMDENGQYTTSYGEVLDYEETVRPATIDDLAPFIYDFDGAPKKKTQKRKTKAKEPEPKNTDEPEESAEECTPEGTMATCPPEEPAVIDGETDISGTGEEFDVGVDVGVPGGDETVAADVPTPEEHCAESCTTEYPVDEADAIAQAYEEPGKPQQSQQKSGTPGAKTTSEPKAESDPMNYDDPMKFEGNVEMPASWFKNATMLATRGLSVENYDLFTEWAMRNGLDLTKLKSIEDDYLKGIVKAFTEELEASRKAYGNI